MTKVLLVSSSFEENTKKEYSDKQWIKKRNDKSHYPMGLAYLHAYMEKHGHEIKTLFLNTHHFDLCLGEVFDTINVFKPDILGLQVLTQNRTSSFRIIEKATLEHPEIKIVLGGIHATVLFKQIIEKYKNVVVVIGEGELTFDELAKKIEAHESLKDIEGIAFWDGEKVVATKPRPLIEDLDILPDPKHELFFSNERKHSCILTTRGCPFRCSFCALESISKRMHRKRSVERCIAEIENLAKAFPNMETVWLHDDTFFLDNERVIRFCDEVIKRGLNRYKFVCSARIKPVSAEMVQKLQQANFKKILFGLESGTDEILMKCHKSITQQDVIETFKLFAKTDIEITTFLIVGLPGETEETNINTAKFIQKIQKIKYNYFDDIGVLMIYPGTEVCRIAKEAGQLTDEYWLSDKPVPFYTVEHSEAKLFDMKRKLLEHIAFRRITTKEGFIKQWHMIPYAVSYLLYKFKEKYNLGG